MQCLLLRLWYSKPLNTQAHTHGLIGHFWEQADSAWHMTVVPRKLGVCRSTSQAGVTSPKCLLPSTPIAHVSLPCDINYKQLPLIKYLLRDQGSKEEHESWYFGVRTCGCAAFCGMDRLSMRPLVGQQGVSKKDMEGDWTAHALFASLVFPLSPRDP